MNKLIKIDADSLCYFSSKETIEESIISIKTRIQSIIEKTKATHYLLCLTGSDCFRYKIYPKYKSGRKVNAIKYPQNLKYLKTLKSFLIEEYNAVLIQEFEADDLVAFNYNLPDFEQSIAACDKDVLNQVEGLHYNYQKDTFINTTKEQGERFLYWQILVGDISDSVVGLGEKTQYIKDKFELDNRKGIGESTANKILDKIYSENLNPLKEIAKCYISKYKDETSGVILFESERIKAYRKGHTKEELGFKDFKTNYHLLKLQTGINKYNKILENYDISKHINEVKQQINDF